MTDLIKTVRNWLDAEDATHFGDFEKGVAAILDRLTAMKAAGDGLGPFVEHQLECRMGMRLGRHYCTCGLSDKLKQWKEASDGL